MRIPTKGPYADVYVQRIKELPRTPALDHYIALFGSTDFGARLQAWDALTEAERTQIMAITEEVTR